ncbi:MAG: RluA family pseudouridine synthase [Kiritimatiellae bacterium]|nr:RluA family pseudouridine synthase [Kiritimatiellia bacterium]
MPSRIITPEARGLRLDSWLSQALPEHSRSRWQQLIETGHVRLNGQPPKARQKLKGGEILEWEPPPPEPTELLPESIPLDVLYEDADLIVINKPPGLVVHPAPGHQQGTLVNALLAHCDHLSGIGGKQRPGIVHRLDRDTSGVMVMAKTEAAHRRLSEQFKGRDVSKEYAAIVWGRPQPSQGTVRTLIARDPHHRQRMSVHVARGRTAVTHYTTEEELGEVSRLRIRIETGRTHQIRVHLAYLGHPVVGDAQYGKCTQKNARLGVARQMLHAARLSFQHPGTGERVEFEATWPPDFQNLLLRLRREGREGSSKM